MTAFIIKSTLGITGFYLLYALLLSGENCPLIKRWYLLSGLALSFILPFVTIGTAGTGPAQFINATPVIENISVVLTGPEGGNEIPENSRINWVIILYIVVTSVMTARYLLNISRLTVLGNRNVRYTGDGYRLAVQEGTAVPFSFLNTVYVSEPDYVNGVVKKEILLHELAHIRQKHSIDVIIVELVQCLLWFNPFVWLYKKEIKQNHEYLADREVVGSGLRTDDYLNFILEYTYRSGTPCMASRLNYSSVKKRFIMLTKERSIKRLRFKATALLPLAALLAMLISSNQSARAFDLDPSGEWWYPIVQKHDITVNSFNNFGDIWESGDVNIISDGISRLTNAIVIMNHADDGGYGILEAEEVVHDLENHLIIAKEGVMKIYSADPNIPEPTTTLFGEIHLNMSARNNEEVERGLEQLKLHLR